MIVFGESDQFSSLMVRFRIFDQLDGHLVNWMAIHYLDEHLVHHFDQYGAKMMILGKKIQNLTKVQQISKNTEIFDFSILSPIWPTLLAGMALPL